MRRAVAMGLSIGTVALVALLGPAGAAQEHEHPAPTGGPAVTLSAGLTALLAEEMLAIEDGIGVLVGAMAAGDWPLVAETGEQIEQSYILKQRLTAEQLAELERVLPPRFKDLDSAFHRSAGKLAAAARARDAEVAIFRLAQLMEACVECHATYATQRFSGFVAPEQGHSHH